MNLPQLCVVDDEQDITRMCADYFSDICSVRTFQTAQDALDAFDADYQPDLILSDIKMPKMSGLEFVKKVKEREKAPPVVIMSGFSEKSHVLEAYDKKVSAFIEKPFDLNKMKTTLQDLIQDSISIKKQEDLIGLYGDLIQFMTGVIEIQSERFVAAENRLYDLNEAAFTSPDQIKNFLSQIKQENHLMREIEAIKKQINDLRAKKELEEF
jgi:YesN/AraC family two-component response regulator